MFERTPVAQITRSASRLSPPAVSSAMPDPAEPSPFPASDVTRVPVLTVMPLSSHQRLIISPISGFVMRETMRSSISMTVRSTFRFASASRMMQPMKPAPISTTFEPSDALSTMRCASASDQQLWTSGRSMPSSGGRVAVAPVAISSLS